MQKSLKFVLRISSYAQRIRMSALAGVLFFVSLVLFVLLVASAGFHSSLTPSVQVNTTITTLTTVTINQSVATHSTTTITHHKELSFLSFDLDAWLSLFATIGLISAVIVLRKSTKTALDYYVSFAGKRAKTIILNTIFLLVGFYAIWSAVRSIGFAVVQMFQFNFQVLTIITNSANTIALVLVVVLSLTLVELVDLALGA